MKRYEHCPCRNPCKLLTVYRAAKRLDMTVKAMNERRTKGERPAHTKLGKSVRYYLCDLMRWADENRVDPAANVDRGSSEGSPVTYRQEGGDHV